MLSPCLFSSSLLNHYSLQQFLQLLVLVWMFLMHFLCLSSLDDDMFTLATSEPVVAHFLASRWALCDTPNECTLHHLRRLREWRHVLLKMCFTRATACDGLVKCNLSTCCRKMLFATCFSLSITIVHSSDVTHPLTPSIDTVCWCFCRFRRTRAVSTVNEYKWLCERQSPHVSLYQMKKQSSWFCNCNDVK